MIEDNITITVKPRCPRCGNLNIEDYRTSFTCPKCRLEFQKADLEKYDSENVLSVEEKKGILDILKDLG